MLTCSQGFISYVLYCAHCPAFCSRIELVLNQIPSALSSRLFPFLATNEPTVFLYGFMFSRKPIPVAARSKA
jgi:hypothetical protein